MSDVSVSESAITRQLLIAQTRALFNFFFKSAHIFVRARRRAAAIHLDQLSWLQPPGEAEFFLHWRCRRAHSERQDLCKIKWMWAWVSHTQKLVDESDAKDFRCAGHEPIEKSMLQVPLLHIEYLPKSKCGCWWLMCWSLVKTWGEWKKIIELWGPAPDLKYLFFAIFTSPTTCAGQLDQPIYPKSQD